MATSAQAAIIRPMAFDPALHLPQPDPSFDAARQLGAPGHFPFTRGIHPTMYVSRPWTMRQYAGFSTAAETNRRYRYLLERGQTGLSVAFDLPTQMGYDPGDEMAKGEVGKAGVSITMLDDMRALFAGIPQEKVTVSMTINATAMILLALYQAAAGERRIPAGALGGTVQNDILKEFIARGCYIYPPRPSLKLAVDVIEYCCKHLPKWNFISVSGYHIREAGSTAAQELGFTLANGLCYVEEALKRGLDPDTVGQRISFFFNAHNNFIEEVAKFRAARRMWARFMKDRFGAKDPRSMMLRFHAQTAGSTLTAQQPENNVVRVAVQALAAVLGGTQSLHTNSMDEALALPTERAAKIALRTQQIIANEAGIADVVDPFGGSWHLERETDRLEREAQGHIDEIARRGGAVAAIEQRYYQQEIEKSATEHQRAVEREERIVVGVNRYEETGSAPRVDLLKVDETIERARKLQVEKAKKRRDAGRAAAAIACIEEEKGNLVPAVLEAVKAGVTLGEISHALRRIHGTYDK